MTKSMSQFIHPAEIESADWSLTYLKWEEKMCPYPQSPMDSTTTNMIILREFRCQVNLQWQPPQTLEAERHDYQRIVKEWERTGMHVRGVF